MKIKLIDLNQDLITQAKILRLDATLGDYFREGYKEDKPVFVTASNPMFTFGGGIDYLFTKHFPKLCEYKQIRGGGNERIANVIFTITVDDTLRSTKEKVEEALRFAINNTSDNETLCLTGLGTGIGGLSVSDFLENLVKIIKEVK